ncbi:MAG: AMP-binding protein [Alphaproteobacteria bacterium]|nr:AMP-binding protein [Alphaproteobacteria bacterium]MCL2757920.1 AMP-binding protein [Alphaproteobacteria bacterium]
MNMYQLLEKTAKKFPENVFLAREGLTYPEFIELVKSRAASFAAQGVKKGDTVGLLAPNIMEWPLSLFAVWYLGGRVLLLDTNLTSFEYDNMAELTGCKLVVATKSFFYKSANFKFYDITTKDAVLRDGAKVPPPADVKSDDVATLSFTSGSTGIPKIVPLTHFNLTKCAASLQDFEYAFKDTDIVYGFLPLYHIFGFAAGFLLTLHFGASILLQPTIDPKMILADFKEFRPHVIPAVPRVFELFRGKILDGLKQKRLLGFASFVLRNNKLLSAIGLGFLVRKIQGKILDVFGGRARLLIAGGAATKPEVEDFYQNLGLLFTQGYGLTETVGPICGSHPRPGRQPYSFGGPLSGNECEMRNVNTEGVGTLWVRGNNVFSGYLNNPEATAEVFDENGWFNTGDLVSKDKNGEYRFRGRKKQVIVLDSGKNVYPDELEGLYITLPGVKNVAVFEHEINGKTIAYAVFSVEDNVDLQSLGVFIAGANKKIASYKWVTHFAITTDELPLTSTKKVRHHVVREKLIAGEYPKRKE